MTTKMNTPSGYVSSTESFGSFDGPGLRYVVFLRGCPLRCKYCHNPETWAPDRTVKEVTTDEVIGWITPYAPYYRSTGGGLTLSGGEPLLQPDFALDLAIKVKRILGLGTVLDTSGVWTAKDTLDPLVPEGIMELIGTVDTILLDLKAIDPELHLWLTGMGNGQPLELLRRATELGKRVIVRRVLVPGITDTPGEIGALKGIVDAHGVELETIPYHTMGKAKWESLGLAYPLDEFDREQGL